VLWGANISLPIITQSLWISSKESSNKHEYRRVQIKDGVIHDEVGIREEENITIARFFSGLSLEIRHWVSTTLYGFEWLCIKVEQQIFRKFVTKKEKVHPKKNLQEVNNSVEKSRIESPKNLEKNKNKKGQISHAHTRDI